MRALAALEHRGHPRSHQRGALGPLLGPQARRPACARSMASPGRRPRRPSTPRPSSPPAFADSPPATMSSTPELMRSYFAGFIGRAGMSLDDLLALEQPGSAWGRGFDDAVLALRPRGRANRGERAPRTRLAPHGREYPKPRSPSVVSPTGITRLVVLERDRPPLRPASGAALVPRSPPTTASGNGFADSEVCSQEPIRDRVCFFRRAARARPGEGRTAPRTSSRARCWIPEALR